MDKDYDKSPAEVYSDIIEDMQIEYARQNSQPGAARKSLLEELEEFTREMARAKARGPAQARAYAKAGLRLVVDNDKGLDVFNAMAPLY